MKPSGSVAVVLAAEPALAERSATVRVAANALDDAVVRVVGLADATALSGSDRIGVGVSVSEAPACAHGRSAADHLEPTAVSDGDCGLADGALSVAVVDSWLRREGPRTDVQPVGAARVDRHVRPAFARSAALVPLNPSPRGVGASLPFPRSRTMRSTKDCEPSSSALNRSDIPGLSSLRIATTTPSPRSAGVPPTSKRSNRMRVPVGFGALVRRKRPAAETLSA
ncbi:MAG: hypothetical protein AAFN74_05915 [Myxococcota bacterium]